MTTSTPQWQTIEYRAMYMLGRCANGSERDKGRNLHITADGSWQALCGKAPGKRSAGWSDYPENVKPPSEATCPACVRKFQKMQPGDFSEPPRP